MKHIILGNGPAGVVAAETLRRAAPADEILLVGNEDARFKLLTGPFTTGHGPG